MLPHSQYALYLHAFQCILMSLLLNKLYMYQPAVLLFWTNYLLQSLVMGTCRYQWTVHCYVFGLFDRMWAVLQVTCILNYDYMYNLQSQVMGKGVIPMCRSYVSRVRNTELNDCSAITWAETIMIIHRRHAFTPKDQMHQQSLNHSDCKRETSLTKLKNSKSVMILVVRLAQLTAISWTVVTLEGRNQFTQKPLTTTEYSQPMKD
jgi:hypothetical protein